MTFYEIRAARRRTSPVNLLLKIVTWSGRTLASRYHDRQTLRALDRLDERLLQDVGLKRTELGYEELRDSPVRRRGNRSS